MVNTAAKATQPLDFQGDGRWLSMHNRFISQTKEKEPEILMIGDSIILQMAQNQIWEKFFVPLHCLNFGIGGDSTQHVLWRIENGCLENISPKVIVIQVGTNNHDNTAAEIIEALLTIVERVHKAQPHSSVLVLGLLPRGQFKNKIRDKISTINKGLTEAIVKYSKFASVLTFDSDLFISPSTGEISDLDMYDYLHLTDRGYKKYCEPILDAMESLLKEFLTQNESIGPVDSVLD